MVDQLTKTETPAPTKPKKRRRPLESYNRTWLGIIAIAVVTVLIGAMLIVKVADVGYRQYTARFQQAVIQMKPVHRHQCGVAQLADQGLGQCRLP